MRQFDVPLTNQIGNLHTPQLFLQIHATHTYTHTRTHARTHTHTHTQTRSHADTLAYRSPRTVAATTAMFITVVDQFPSVVHKPFHHFQHLCCAQAQNQATRFCRDCCLCHAVCHVHCNLKVPAWFFGILTLFKQPNTQTL